MKECGCQRCGGELLPRGDFYICKHCHKTFTDVTVEKARAQFEASLRNMVGEAIQEELIKREAEKFRPLLGQLWEKTQAKYTDSDAIVRICQQIKNIYPENFLANFYEVANSGTVEEIADFLNGIDEKEYAAYVDDVVEFMIKSLEMGYVAPLNYLIERAYKNTNMPAFERYSTKVEEEASRLDAGTYNTEIPREVFVAYSSKDMQEVIKLVERIEAQGVRCFFAMRNLRHGRGAKANYEREIEKAIDNCKTIIFVSSKNSRRLDCDALNIELPYVKKKDVENTPPGLKRDYTKIPQRYKKLRIEYRLDNEKTPMADVSLREFFAGLEYRKSLDDVLDLLAMYLTDGDALVEENVVLEKERKSSFTKEDIKQYIAELDREKQEEAARKRAEEEARQAALKLQAEAAARKHAEEVEKRVAQRLAEIKAEEEAAQKRAEEEAARRRAEEEAARKKAEEEAARKRTEEAARRRAEEEVARKRAEEVAWKRAEKEMAQLFAERWNQTGENYYYGKNGVQQSYGEAVKWYQKAAEQGDADAQNNLGNCYCNGQGVAQNYAEAVKWYQKAAVQGYANAQFNLGQCYQEGWGVEPSFTEAVKWYQKAAVQGHAEAQYKLGWFYYSGFGVKEDGAESLKWTTKAAENGSVNAQELMGDYYYDGFAGSIHYDTMSYYYDENRPWLLEKDYAEAAKWYSKAAEQGSSYGQHKLAYCYEHGEGVPQSYEKAMKWYQKAAEQGDENGKEGYERVKDKVSQQRNNSNYYDESFEFEEEPVRKKRGFFGWFKKG